MHSVPSSRTLMRELEKHCAHFLSPEYAYRDSASFGHAWNKTMPGRLTEAFSTSLLSALYTTIDNLIVLGRDDVSQIAKIYDWLFWDRAITVPRTTNYFTNKPFHNSAYLLYYLIQLARNETKPEVQP